MKETARMDSRTILSLIASREISCEEYMRSCIDRIGEYNPVLNAFISLADEGSLLDMARKSDERRANGEPLSSIDGVPIGVKDNIHARGLNTTCASRSLENYAPPFDATVVERMRAGGGIVIGKTNMDEFAMGSTCENSCFDPSRNPWDIHRVPGGSSGGSAIAVSTGMVPLAIGSDTGGSIRQPASFCGVAGIKPTYGLVSRYGLVAYASSLDQIGPLARDVYGTAALLSIIAGHDPKDSTSLENDAPDYRAFLDTVGASAAGIQGLRIAVFPEMLGEGVTPAVKENFRATLAALASNGAVVEEVPFPAVEYLISTYYFIATAEAASNLSRYDGVRYGFRSGKLRTYQEMLFTSRSYGFSREVQKRILLGNFVLSSGYYDEYYRKAQKTRAMIREELKRLYARFDLIAMPTTPDTAFPKGESVSDPMRIYLADVTTVMPNLAGLPAISVPSGLVSSGNGTENTGGERGLPVGIQFMGRPLEEAVLFRAARAVELSVGTTLVPPLHRIPGLHSPAAASNGKQEERRRETTAANLYTKERIREVSSTYRRLPSPAKPRVYCADLARHVDKEVEVCGWIHRRKNLGGIEFFDLRDRTGFTQLVIEGEKPVEKLNLETVVRITGTVAREERSPYDNIEIKVKALEVLGHAEGNLPVSVNGPVEGLNLPTILDNRPISIRNPQILFPFRVQAEVVRLFADYLRGQGFTEIKTTKIVSSGTEGGTNIFELKYFDRAAYLAQSPQFYKQTMVGSGLERVFEINPVFRAEHHDTVRHLNEYTSLDFEMGFIRNEQEIIDMQEGLLRQLFAGVADRFGGELAEMGVEIRFPDAIPRIHFLEALDILLSRGVKDMEEGDISPAGEKALCEYFQEKEGSELVYVIGYPVKKRPMYTMPDERRPGYTRSCDLLYRGLEITTGGQRIHDYHRLKENIVEFGHNPGDFKDYLAIFKYGMPPHGGLGMGLERLTMKLLNLRNVREACLFPRDINRITP